MLITPLGTLWRMFSLYSSVMSALVSAACLRASSSRSLSFSWATSPWKVSTTNPTEPLSSRSAAIFLSFRYMLKKE